MCETCACIRKPKCGSLYMLNTRGSELESLGSEATCSIAVSQLPLWQKGQGKTVHVYKVHVISPWAVVYGQRRGCAYNDESRQVLCKPLHCRHVVSSYDNVQASTV